MEELNRILIFECVEVYNLAYCLLLDMDWTKNHTDYNNNSSCITTSACVKLVLNDATNRKTKDSGKK